MSTRNYSQSAIKHPLHAISPLNWGLTVHKIFFLWCWYPPHKTQQSRFGLPLETHYTATDANHSMQQRLSTAHQASPPGALQWWKCEWVLPSAGPLHRRVICSLQSALKCLPPWMLAYFWQTTINVSAVWFWCKVCSFLNPLPPSPATFIHYMQVHAKVKFLELYPTSTFQLEFHCFLSLHSHMASQKFLTNTIFTLWGNTMSWQNKHEFRMHTNDMPENMNKGCK